MSNPSALTDFSELLSHSVAGVAPHVVAIHSHHSRSSGFIWCPSLIVTADEALAEGGDIEVTLPGGECVVATVVGRDPTTDIAVLRVERDELEPIELHTEPLQPGALALAIGSYE